VCALYHPPPNSNVLYTPDELIKYISETLDEISDNSSDSVFIIAGDFNQLRDSDFISLGLINVVEEPTHQGHKLDRIYTSMDLFHSTRVIQSTVKTAHKAIVARERDGIIVDQNKTHKVVQFRRHSATQAACFLASLQQDDWNDFLQISDVQAAADLFYQRAVRQLDAHFPLATVTMSSRDPPFVTPAIKAMLREKNQLMRAGKVEKAGALSAQIGQLITLANSKWLAKTDPGSSGGAKAMWHKVNSITGKGARTSVTPPDCRIMNAHYAAISQDPGYIEPQRKDSCVDKAINWPSEYALFNCLDQLKPTATGPDGLPSWFLKLAAPAYSKPLAHLFAISLSSARVPTQWKEACITPVPKIPGAATPGEFRPISLTSQLSRIFEKLLNRDFLYPMLDTQPVYDLLSDQYAFRPNGSTTAALIAILADITAMLENNRFVHVIALDFSKAFDTVRHSTLMNKIASLPISDNVYNWIVDYLHRRSHCTKCNDATSTPLEINASIVQGSAIGPIAFILNAYDLRPSAPGNKMHKYADDSYLLIPASNSHTITAELTQIGQWAASNNLKLNTNKSTEMIVRNKRTSIDSAPPPPAGVERAAALEILGVKIQDNLSMAGHVESLIGSANQNLYALKTLKSHGLPDAQLNNVCRATMIARILYASPAWFGFASAGDRTRLQAIISKAARWGVWPKNGQTLDQMLCAADKSLFSKVLNNSSHVLHSLLPPIKSHGRNLRKRAHNRILPLKTPSLERNFLIRMLYNNH
jgi:hypothetical protein